MIWKCKENCSDCCGVVPLKREVFEKFKYLKQREIKEVMDFGDGEIIPMTEDLRCIFIKDNFKCAIYDYRPSVCSNYGLTKELQCPHIKSNGNSRSPAKVRRVQRQIKHNINYKLKEWGKRN